MQRKDLVLFFASVLLMMTSCSDESIVPVPSANDGNLPSIVFTIVRPSADPVTYALEQDLNESRIETLDVYEFDCDGKSSLEEAVLRTVYTANTEGYEWSDAQVGGSNGSRLVLNLDLDDTGERIFLFVANAGCATNSGTAEDLTQLTSGSITMEAFMQKLTRELADESPATPFLMTGFSERIKIVHEMQYSGHIAMTRAVARIDLCTMLSNANDLLAITSITLKNAPKSSCLFPMPKLTETETEITYENPADVVTYKTKTTAASDYVFETEEPGKQRTKRLFYLYERAQHQFEEKGAPTLSIEGEYTPENATQAVKVYYEIPFDRSVKRNYLYTVQLGVENDLEGYKGRVSGITVEKWRGETEIPTEVALFTVTVNENKANYAYDKTTHTLTIASPAAQSLTDVFTVVSAFKDDILTFEMEDPNTTKTITDPNNGWITNGAIVNGKVSFDVAENTLGVSREGVIWIKSSNDSTGADAYGIKIVQKGEVEVAQNALLSFSSFSEKCMKSMGVENSFFCYSGVRAWKQSNRIMG